MLAVVNLCESCARYKGWGPKDDGRAYCDAFPDGDGIPPEIHLFGFDHRNKFGSEPLVYEMRPGAQLMLRNYEEAVAEGVFDPIDSSDSASA
jgi:hypothetical protein